MVYLLRETNMSNGTSTPSLNEPTFQDLSLNIPDLGDFGLVSDYVIQYIYTINLSIICAACCLFGIVSNVINILIFVNLKFKETINIALTGLSISDLFSVISLLWTTICFNPLFMYSDSSILTIELQHKTGGWTHVMFTRVSAFITVYITLERCLCIAFPLKVKSLLTPKLVTAILVTIFIVILGSMSINYSYFKLTWKFVPSMNKTMFGMVYTEKRYAIQTVVYYFGFFYPILSFTSVVVCSVILVWTLYQRNKWLLTATSDSNKTKSTRDRKVIKMVVCVALIFIFTFTPSVVFFLASAIERQLNVGGRYENMFIVIYSISMTSGAINSSVNIFVYYKMSTKYAGAFRVLFRCKEPPQTEK